MVEHAIPTIWSSKFVELLLFLVLAGSALTTALRYWLVSQEEVGRLTLVLVLVSIMSGRFAIVFCGERLDLVQELGDVLTVAGIGVAASATRPASETNVLPGSDVVTHLTQCPGCSAIPSIQVDDAQR